MKATNLIYGVILMSLVMVSFTLLIGDLTTNYGTTWDNSTFGVYNKINETESQSFALQSKINSTTDTGVTDLVGNFVTKAVDSLKLTYSSLDASIEMVETAGEDVGVPKYYVTAIVTMLVIFLVLGVIISAMVNSSL